MKLIPENHTVASSVELLEGTSSSTVTDLQVLNDGNSFDITEAAGTPGQRFKIFFVNIIRFSGLAFKAYYDGNHYIEFQLYNCVTGSWDTQITIESSNGMDYRLIDVPNSPNYISNIGGVTARHYHPSAGNPADDSFIEYVALIR